MNKTENIATKINANYIYGGYQIYLDNGKDGIGIGKIYDTEDECLEAIVKTFPTAKIDVLKVGENKYTRYFI